MGGSDLLISSSDFLIRDKLQFPGLGNPDYQYFGLKRKMGNPQGRVSGWKKMGGSDLLISSSDFLIRDKLQFSGFGNPGYQ